MLRTYSKQKNITNKLKIWTDQSTITLIKMYQQYDPDLLQINDHSKNPQLKRDLWAIIAQRHETTIPEVQNKIKLLLSKFAIELRRYNRYRLSESYFQNNPWKFFRNFMFLLEIDDFANVSTLSESCLSDSNSISKMFSTEDRSRTPSSSSQQDQESQDFQSSVNFDEIFEVNEDEEEHEDKSPANKKRRLNDSHTPLEDALKCIKTLLDENDKRDEHSVYGEHIANKLRNCNRSNSDIAIAQHHIENIVFNLSMGVYREEAENSIDNKTNLMIPPVNTRDVPDPIILTVPDPVIIPKPEPSP
ncbi:uncharacterized protein LOC129915640 isoform X1 [Episyrphus balteatus]|uniref:uncharacterized protein LOC129915640 isoform X1 n=1 Tax=Episyrphus balteatus TaxID=286459 RepID=UPI002485577A|nr:uncharacterized protein LOC129915640 isoform X1 [Episyrphus balteatus]